MAIRLDTQTVVNILFTSLLTYRYLTGIVYFILWLLYHPANKPFLIPSSQTTNTKVSIVCATVGISSGLLKSIETWLVNNPDEIIVVTDVESHRYISEALNSLPRSPYKTNIKLLTCPRTNKRAQLCLGFNACQRTLILIADDDTIGSPTSLSAMTFPFERWPNLGGLFPEVQIRPQKGSTRLTFWETLASIRLFGDAIDGRASVLLDGGVFCASGSTAAYRASILRDSSFQDMFQTEEWGGQRLNAGDDQSLTRWLDRCGWDVMVMPDDGTGVLGYGGIDRQQACRVETHGE